jgi:hypothetical protein
MMTVHTTSSARAKNVLIRALTIHQFAEAMQNVMLSIIRQHVDVRKERKEIQGSVVLLEAVNTMKTVPIMSPAIDLIIFVFLYAIHFLVELMRTAKVSITRKDASAMTEMLVIRMFNAMSRDSRETKRSVQLIRTAHHNWVASTIIASICVPTVIRVHMIKYVR